MSGEGRAGNSRAVEEFEKTAGLPFCLSQPCCRRHGTGGDLFGKLASLAPNDQPEDAQALGAFVAQHVVPVSDRRYVGQLPLDVARDANGFSAHGG
jgi:hypothetical protein